MPYEDSAPKYPVVADDIVGLEVVPPPELEPAPYSWSYPNNWQQQQRLNEKYYPAGSTEATEGLNRAGNPNQRILGLPVRTFWIIIIAVVVVVAAAIGGGLGGGLAARSSSISTQSDHSSTQTSPTQSDQSSTRPSPTHTPGGPCHSVNSDCAPAGLDIDYYSNPFVGYSSGSLPSSYYFTRGLRPLNSSLTDVTFFPQDDEPSLPAVYPDPSRPSLPYFVGWTRATNGGITVDANNFTLVYQGFYRAQQTGSHTICSSADNENDVFFGHGSAFSCLDGRPSADAVPLLNSTGGYFNNGIVCREVTLVSGLYYPVRNVIGNWQGPSAFNFTIREPGVASESTNIFTGRAYPRKCGIFV